MRPRFAFPGRRHVLDLVYLAILTVVIPVLVFSYVYNKEKQDLKLYDVAEWTFFIGLAFFHVLCYLRQGSASRQLPRLIDYIYVCSAVIGLSGAAVEADRTVRVNGYSESVRLSELNLSWMKDQVDKAEKAVCAENNNSGAQCAELTSISAFIKEGLPNALASHDLALLEEFTRKVDTRIATLTELPEAERSHIAHYDRTVQRLAATTSIPPEPDYSWRMLGILFLPSALALRITKISVEVFGWFPKA